MFNRKTPKKWRVKSNFYSCSIETDKYGNEKIAYQPELNNTISVAWQSLNSSSEQSEYGNRCNEHLQSALFNDEYGTLEIKNKDKFVIRNTAYIVCAVEYLPSYRLVTVERVR